MGSPIRQLLDEISWEGNARKYRGGGVGNENVMTTEVFHALDLLPRPHFMAAVLGDVRGGSGPRLQALGADADAMAVEVLPGDLKTDDGQVTVQPDVLLSSDSTFIFVEAKAPSNRASFQPEQLARELVVTRDHARGRIAVLLLILGTEPPIALRGQGRRSVEDAITHGLGSLAARGLETSKGKVDVCWTTWQRIAERTGSCLATFSNADPSVVSAVTRCAHQLTDAVRAHSEGRSGRIDAQP
jgi:hypothetical protein